MWWETWGGGSPGGLVGSGLDYVGVSFKGVADQIALVGGLE